LTIIGSKIKEYSENIYILIKKEKHES